MKAQPIDPASTVFDGTKIDGPAGLRKWLAGYSDQFVEVAAEKLMTYALGRGVDYQDMPLVRSIAHDAAETRQSILGARSRHREKQTVPDEHEDASDGPMRQRNSEEDKQCF